MFLKFTSNNFQLTVSYLVINLIVSFAINAEPGKSVVDREKQQEAERIVISAYRDPFLTDVPVSITAIHLDLEPGDAANNAVLSILDKTPGVFANGQGGMFQTFSIRGSAKNRIRTLVEGIPIVTERRAGISASFIDPMMIQSIDIMRGPVSTFYGTGALGGAINFFLPTETATQTTVGAQSQSSGVYGHYMYANTNTQAGISHRNMGKSQAANGQLLNDAFSSTNLYLRKQWQTEDVGYELFWLETSAQDIGKSNRRYQISRNTSYPSEEHSLLKFQVRHDSGWLSSVFFHPNKLITDNEHLNSNRTRSHNSSDDFGVSFQQETDLFNGLSESIDAQWGLDWFARRNVAAFEIEYERGTVNRSRREVIQNGSLDDLALFMSAIISKESAQWHLGGRYNQQQTSVVNSHNVTDDTLTAFAGYSRGLSDSWSLEVNLASGFRFPTLSERFFSGTTARGETIAPTNLEKETSLNLDIALLWQSNEQLWQFNAFRMDVENYIEPVRLETGERTYVNLNSGRIDGLELQYIINLNTHLWEMSYSHYQGRADDGGFLSDIPTDELTGRYQYVSENWRLNLSWQHRLEKRRTGTGEVPNSSYNLVALDVNYQLDSYWSLSIAINNLLDENYVASNDELDTFATGRNLSLSLHWQE